MSVNHFVSSAVLFSHLSVFDHWTNKTQSGNRSCLDCLSLWYPVIINTVELWDGKIGTQNYSKTLVATFVFRIQRPLTVSPKPSSEFVLTSPASVSSGVHCESSVGFSRWFFSDLFRFFSIFPHCVFWGEAAGRRADTVLAAGRLFPALLAVLICFSITSFAPSWAEPPGGPRWRPPLDVAQNITVCLRLWIITAHVFQCSRRHEMKR